MQESPIKTNLLKDHSGKYFEVCTFATNNNDEKCEVIGKFLYKCDALFFFENLPNQQAYHEIIIR
jgi:hypothetical protein